MRAVILRFIINDYLSHAQVNKIKNSQWALAGLPILDIIGDYVKKDNLDRMLKKN